MFIMNWQAVRSLTIVQVGALLALLIVAVMPNFGLKYGASPALPALLLAFLGGWLLWKERARLFEAPAARRLTLVFALLLLPVLISIPESYRPRVSASVAGMLVVYYLTGLALVRVLRGDAERAWLAKWILVVLAFWIADSVIQYLFGVDLFGVPRGADQRVLGPFYNSLRQPLLIALLLPVALWVLQRRGALPAMLFLVAAGFIATLGAVRMVLVMLVLVAAAFYLRLPRWRFKWVAMVLALIAVLVAIGLTPALKERMTRFTEIRELNFATIDRLLSYRAMIWETAGHMLVARPLHGVGVGGFEKAYPDYATRPDDPFRDGTARVHHAHQVYVAFAAEAGLPGLLGLIAALALGVKWYRGAPPARRDQAWPYALGLFVYFFPINTQPPLYHGNWLFPLILLLFAAMLAALDEPALGASPPERV